MINISDDKNIVSPQNNLVGEESIDLIKVMEKLITDGHLNFHVDFSKVITIDATGICALLFFKKNLTPDADIKFIHMERKIKALFSTIRIQQALLEEK